MLNYTYRIGELLFFGMISIGANLGSIATMKPAFEAGENIVKLLHMRPQVQDGKIYIVSYTTIFL